MHKFGRHRQFTHPAQRVVIKHGPINSGSPWVTSFRRDVKRPASDQPQMIPEARQPDRLILYTYKYGTRSRGPTYFMPLINALPHQAIRQTHDQATSGDNSVTTSIPPSPLACKIACLELLDLVVVW